MPATASPVHRYVDADGHTIEPPTALQDYVPADFRDRVLHLETDGSGQEWVVADGKRVKSDLHNFMAVAGLTPEEKIAAIKGESGWVFGQMSRIGWDAKTRLQYMDKDEIDISVLYPSMLLAIQGWPDADYAITTCRAYNDWLSDHCSESGGRLYGVAALPQQSIEASAAELRRVAEKPGIVGGFIRPNPTSDWKYYFDPVWNPLWHVASDTNLTIGFHPYLDALLPGAVRGLRVDRLNRGTLMPDGGKEPANMFPGQSTGVDNLAFSQGLGNPVDMMTAVTFITMGGVAERFPDVRFVFLESNGGWLVPLLERLDHHAHEFAWDVPDLKLAPSEYFRRQCWISFDPDESTLASSAQSRFCGAERIVWASDFPHPDAKYPGLTEELAEALESLTDDEQEAITCDNALRLYNIQA